MVCRSCRCIAGRRSDELRLARSRPEACIWRRRSGAAKSGWGRASRRAAATARAAKARCPARPASTESECPDDVAVEVSGVHHARRHRDQHAAQQSSAARPPPSVTTTTAHCLQQTRPPTCSGTRYQRRRRAETGGAAELHGPESRRVVRPRQPAAEPRNALQAPSARHLQGSRKASRSLWSSGM